MNPLTKSDHDKLHSDFDKNISEMKAMNEHIATMLAKLHDKSDNKTEKKVQTMPLKITDLSSKQGENIQN